MPKETIGTDINGRPDFSLDFPDVGTSTGLTANVEQTVTVPAYYNRAFFSYSVGTNVFVNLNATAAAPGGSFASTTTELNPSVRKVKGGDVLHVISPTNAYVQISFRQGQGDV